MWTMSVKSGGSVPWSSSGLPDSCLAHFKKLTPEKVSTILQTYFLARICFFFKCPSFLWAQLTLIQYWLQIIAWWWTSNKLFSKPMRASSLYIYASPGLEEVMVACPWCMWFVVTNVTHWGRDKMAAISQTIFWYALPWMKSFVFWLKFHWSLFWRVQFTTTHHRFIWWLGIE